MRQCENITFVKFSLLSPVAEREQDDTSMS